MEYKEYKPRNYITYLGRLNRYWNQTGQIIEENETSHDQRNFTTSISAPYSDVIDKITAYENELRGISVTKEFLEKNGFVLNEKTKQFSNNGTIIFRPAFVKPTTDLLGRETSAFDDLGFRVIVEVISDFNDQEEIERKTLSVQLVHFFQNYYEVILGQPREVAL